MFSSKYIRLLIAVGVTFLLALLLTVHVRHPAHLGWMSSPQDATLSSSDGSLKTSGEGLREMYTAEELVFFKTGQGDAAKHAASLRGTFASRSRVPPAFER